MSTEGFAVQNVNCAGGANNIVRTLNAFPGAENEFVDITQGAVQTGGMLKRSQIAQGLGHRRISGK